MKIYTKILGYQNLAIKLNHYSYDKIDTILYLQIWNFIPGSNSIINLQTAILQELILGDKRSFSLKLYS